MDSGFTHSRSNSIYIKQLDIKQQNDRSSLVHDYEIEQQKIDSKKSNVSKTTSSKNRIETIMVLYRVFDPPLNRYYSISYEDIRSFLDYSNIGVSQFTNVDDFFSNDKIIILQEIKYQSKINSFLNDFFILSLSPLIFLPFFVFFKKKN